jgi:hypothetical protein
MTVLPPGPELQSVGKRGKAKYPWEIGQDMSWPADKLPSGAERITPCLTGASLVAATRALHIARYVMQFFEFERTNCIITVQSPGQ